MYAIRSYYELQSVGYALPLPGGLRRFSARLERNGPDEVVAIVEDVTERLRTSEALQEQFRNNFV